MDEGESDEPSATADGASSSTSSDDGDGNGFVPPVPDTPGQACNPYLSECPVDEKCSLVDLPNSDLDYRCVPLPASPVADGEPCRLLGESLWDGDECGEGSICWDIMDDGWGRCLAFCDGTDDDPTCADGYVCNTFKDGGGLCTPACKPLAGDCPATCGCFWAGFAFWCVPLTENIPVGEPCGFINDCARDHICMDGAYLPSCEGAACCVSFCDLGQGNPKCEPAGTECVPFFDEGQSIPGYEPIGVC
ncbi:MAG: hypothetical protein KC457_27235, partial [Myxococcales bacterium]|nr:hypothetical protein [Myxococcales bacterium]